MAKVLHPRYFPFCRVDNYDEIDPFNKNRSFSGSASTLEAQMAAYWKVKTWKVNYSGGNPNEPPDIVTAEGIYGYDVPDERHLVCLNEFKELSFTSNVSPFQQHGFTIIDPLQWGEFAAAEDLSIAFGLLYYPADDGTLGGQAYSGYGDPTEGTNQTLQVAVPGGVLSLPVFLIDSAPPRKPCSITITPYTFGPTPVDSL